MRTKTPMFLWLAEAKQAPGYFLYIDEHGRSARTPSPKHALRCRTEEGCQAYIEEFCMEQHFAPTAHCFD